MGRRGIKTTPEKKAIFLEALSKSPNISEAARIACIDRRTAYKFRDDDPKFALAMEAAIDEAIDGLEREAQRRAFEGCDEPIGFDKGEHQGMFVKKYSDTLAIFLLKAHRPERFRDKHEIKHTGEIAINVIGDEEDM